MHHYTQAPPQWYPYYAPAFSNGPGNHQRPKKGKGKGKAGVEQQAAAPQQDYPPGTRFCLACAATGKVVPHNDTRWTTCRKCNAPLPDALAAESSPDGPARKKGKGPGTPDGGGQTTLPQLSKSAGNGGGPRLPKNLNDTTRAKEALAAAGGVTLPDIQFVQNFSRDVQLKAQGLAEEFPGLSSLTDQERKTMANAQAMLDAILTMAEGDQDKTKVTELTNTLQRLKTKSQARSGEHEGARLHRILSTLKTTWARAQDTLQAEIEAANEALVAAQDRAAKAAKAKIDAEALFRKRQEQVQQLLKVAAPIPVSGTSTTAAATTTVPAPLAAATISSILSQLMERLEASGRYKTSEGTDLPVLEGIKAFSKEIVTTLTCAEQSPPPTAVPTAPGEQAAVAGEAASSTGQAAPPPPTEQKAPLPTPPVDLAWGEANGNESEEVDVEMAVAIGVPEDESNAASVDW
jgi:hypothetical protein